MNLKNAISIALKTCHIPSVVPCFIAEPGCGKTQASTAGAAAFAKQAGKQAAVICFHASQIDALDTKGIPHVLRQEMSDGTTRVITTWSMAGLVYEAWKAYEAGYMVFIFLDELLQASQAVQIALRQLLSEHRLGADDLPPGTRIFAASNRMKDKAGVNAAASHFINVLMVLEIDHNLQTDWMPWATEQTPALLPFFLDWMEKQSHEHIVKEVPKSPNTPYPTIRSCTNAEHVIRVLSPDHADGVLNLSPDVSEAVAGLVGTSTAVSLMSHAKITEHLPTIAAIRSNPRTAEFPDRPDLYSALVHLIPQVVPTESEIAGDDPFAMNQLTEEHSEWIAAALAYTERLPAEFRPLTWGRILRRGGGTLTTHPGIKAMIRDNKDTLIAASSGAH